MITKNIVQAGFACLFLGLAACATADADNTSRAELAEAGIVSGVTEDGVAVRCERIRVTGSRQTQRICLPESRWEQREQDAQIITEDAARGSSVVNSPSEYTTSGGTGRN
ncbi:MAG: hypothetical protein ACQRW7_01835 [Caulobacterales bacterium]|uniref:hypothetical protein n=1 Tax=Glycocaulis sp. TaxID=1969725 RepID=UPI003FA15D3B